MTTAVSSSGWLATPQRVWLRRALFQVHLWTGLGIGLYVVLMSLTGSAIVFRGELGRVLTPLQTVVPNGGPRKSVAELTQIAQGLYPRFAVTDVRVSSDPTAAVEIVMMRNNRYRDHVFDPYTGKDLGNRVPIEPRAVAWVADLHDNLLGGATGRAVNGVGAVAFTVLCLTGAVVWWPGVERWRRSLTIRWNASWRRLTWDAHSAMGFWIFVLLLWWGVSGVYLAFPDPFYAGVDKLAAMDASGRAADWADWTLSKLAELHFGRFAGTGTKIAYVTLGLVPAALLVTGAVMWWTRKVRPARRAA